MSECNPLARRYFRWQYRLVIHNIKSTHGGYLEVKGFQDPFTYSWENHMKTNTSNFWTHCRLQLHHLLFMSLIQQTASSWLKWQKRPQRLQQANAFLSQRVTKGPRIKENRQGRRRILGPQNTPPQEEHTSQCHVVARWVVKLLACTQQYDMP